MKADYVHKDSKTSTNETISYKITMPLIDTEELQRIDNNYNELVDEFIKQFVKEKDMIIAQRIMMNLRKENKQYDSLMQKVESQQKKFIEYLEDYIEVLKSQQENVNGLDILESQQENVNGLDILEEETLFILEETLEKYKEIIGEKDE